MAGHTTPAMDRALIDAEPLAKGSLALSSALSRGPDVLTGGHGTLLCVTHTISQRLSHNCVMQNAWMAKDWKNLRLPHERLTWARSQKYSDPKDAAEAMGVTPSTYYGHENGSRGLARAASRYASFFGVSLDWLVNGKGDPRSSATSSTAPENFIRVPLLEWVAAGRLANPASQIPVESVPLLAFADLGRGDFFCGQSRGQAACDEQVLRFRGRRRNDLQDVAWWRSSVSSPALHQSTQQADLSQAKAGYQRHRPRCQIRGGPVIIVLAAAQGGIATRSHQCLPNLSCTICVSSSLSPCSR